MGEPGANLSPFEAARRQRASLLRIVRICFFSLFLTVVLLAILGGEPVAGDVRNRLVPQWELTLLLGIGLAIVIIAVDLLTPRKKISTLFSIFFGLLGAMLATVAISFVIDLLVRSYEIKDETMVGAVKVMIGMGLAYLGISTVLQTQDDFRLVIPYVEFAKMIRGPRPMLLDTSAIIDGRFADLLESGLLQSPVVIPRYVIDELQLLADQEDRSRRARGRRGLQMVARMQRCALADVTIEDSSVPGTARGVDQALIEQAEQIQGVIVTTDSGLARVAGIRKVQAVNLHELASALRPMISAGAGLTLRIVKPGEQPGQGVGFLDDGTMVVVEDGAAAVGQEVGVVTTGTLQTAAGRMLFARLAPGSEGRTEEAAPEPEPGPAQGDAPSMTSDGGDGSDKGDRPAGQRFAQPRAVGPFPAQPPNRPRAGTPRNPRR
ncbi:MAG: PIN/TRAM domain-containing protein [Phycisphaerae bacterium]|nr:PIN/TRAM domain-containing protein [Phycisphaerae bacterium]